MSTFQWQFVSNLLETYQIHFCFWKIINYNQIELDRFMELFQFASKFFFFLKNKTCSTIFNLAFNVLCFRYFQRKSFCMCSVFWRLQIYVLFRKLLLFQRFYAMKKEFGTLWCHENGKAIWKTINKRKWVMNDLFFILLFFSHSIFIH